jgi:hypothetical protein
MSVSRSTREVKTGSAVRSCASARSGRCSSGERSECTTIVAPPSPANGDVTFLQNGTIEPTGAAAGTFPASNGDLTGTTFHGETATGAPQ